MQALVLRGAGEIVLEECRVPTPPPGEVLIAVAACGICGSDLHGYLGQSKRRSANLPLIMGHEFTGRIVALGEGVSGFNLQDRVVVQPLISCGHCHACRRGKPNICQNMSLIGIERPGAFAKYVSVPAHRAFALPASLDDISASLTETLAVEVHLFREYAPLYPRTVAVLGAGAQGLLAVHLAWLSGAEQIIVTDLFDDRLEMAAAAGATTTIRADQENPVMRVMQATDGWGADFIIDAVGSPVTRQQGVAMAAPNGTIGLIGLGIGETMLDYLPIVNKELHLHGSYCYSDDDFLMALEMLATKRVHTEDMIQTAPLCEGEAYFKRLIDNPAGLTKVVLIPN